MTTRYRFSLGQVLRVRRIEEDQAAGRLAAARAEATSAAAVHDGRRAVLAEMAPPAGPIGAERLLAWHDRVGLAGDALRIAAAAQTAAAEVLDARRVEYTDAAGKVSALQRLDERRRDDHRRQALKEEAAILDDLALARRAHGGDRR